MNEISPPVYEAARPNDLDPFWMPYSNNRGFKTAPRMLSRAEGMSYYTPDGREVIDGTAGLWCVNAGHGRREITEAIQRQAAVMDFAPTFQLGHPIAFQAAAKVAEMTPPGLDRIFFTNSGSESADTALKIALAYHRARGEGQRTRLVGRERGYHGVGFGGMSVGGIGPNRKQFGAMLPYVDHLPHTHLPERNAFTRGQPEHGAHLADALEGLVTLHGADTIAAVMVEPLAGSTGVLVPPKGYLERLRVICDKYGILLIFDEVITGFGRIGAGFGSERLGVAPDILTMAKGLTNAAVPMGAVAVHDHVYHAIVDGAPAGIELFHGYTYSGHPLAAAAAIASVDLHRAEDLPGRARAMEKAVRGRGPCVAGRAERHRHPQHGPGRRHRIAAARGRADGSGGARVPPLLRRRRADPHHCGHHRAVPAADRRGRAYRAHRGHGCRRAAGGGRLIPAGS